VAVTNVTVPFKNKRGFQSGCSQQTCFQIRNYFFQILLTVVELLFVDLQLIAALKSLWCEEQESTWRIQALLSCGARQHCCSMGDWVSSCWVGELFNPQQSVFHKSWATEFFSSSKVTCLHLL